MAIAALALAEEAGINAGQPTFGDVVSLNITGSSYVAGGEAFEASFQALTGRSGREVLAVVQLNQPSAHIWRYNRSTGKIQAFTTSLVEETPGQDTDATGLQLLVISI